MKIREACLAVKIREDKLASGSGAEPARTPDLLVPFWVGASEDLTWPPFPEPACAAPSGLVKNQPVDDGELVLVELAWKGTLSRKNEDGPFGRYVKCNVVCSCGTHSTTHLESTISSDKDAGRKLN